MAKERLDIVVGVDGVNSAKNQLNKMGTATKGVTGGLTAMLGPIAMVAGSLYAAKEAFSFVVEKGAEFEKGMADVKAVSGATDVELAKLSATARALG